jgi:hypothetical protein
MRECYIYRDDAGDEDCPKYFYAVIDKSTGDEVSSHGTLEGAQKWARENSYIEVDMD